MEITNNEIYTDLTLENEDFSKGVFELVKLADSQISNSQLVASTFRKSRFEKMAFDHCRMTGSTFIESTYYEVTFKNCKLDLSHFRFSKFRKCKFVKCVLEKGEFASTDLTGTIFDGCSMLEIGMFQSILKDVDVRTSQIQGIKANIESLKGLKITLPQAMDLVYLLEVQVE